MTQAYFVECYWPGATESRLAHAAESVMGAPRSRDDARCIDLILIPDDEIVLGFFSGPSPESVRDRAERAGIPAERIVRCVRLTRDRNP